MPSAPSLRPVHTEQQSDCSSYRPIASPRPIQFHPRPSLSDLESRTRARIKEACYLAKHETTYSQTSSTYPSVYHSRYPNHIFHENDDRIKLKIIRESPRGTAPPVCLNTFKHDAPAFRLSLIDEMAKKEAALRQDIKRACRDQMAALSRLERTARSASSSLPVPSADQELLGCLYVHRFRSFAN